MAWRPFLRYSDLFFKTHFLDCQNKRHRNHVDDEPDYFVYFFKEYLHVDNDLCDFLIQNNCIL